MLCFANKIWERLEQVVDRFWNALAHELYCLKACRTSKIHARFHEITMEPFASSNYKTIDKTNHDFETNNSDVEKSKNSRKKDLKDEANNMHLDKECTQRSNLNSKYLSVTLCLKRYPDSFICFYPAAGKCFQKAIYLAVWNCYFHGIINSFLKVVDLPSLSRSCYQQCHATCSRLLQTFATYRRLSSCYGLLCASMPRQLWIQCSSEIHWYFYTDRAFSAGWNEHFGGKTDRIRLPSIYSIFEKPCRWVTLVRRTTCKLKSLNKIAWRLRPKIEILKYSRDVCNNNYQ